MTQNALAKLNQKQMEYLEVLSFIIEKTRQSHLEKQHENTCGKLRGFLECLCQLGILSGSEVPALYLYFYAENRRGSVTSVAGAGNMYALVINALPKESLIAHNGHIRKIPFTDGENIVCHSKAQAEAIADLLESFGYVSMTSDEEDGYFLAYVD